MVCDIAVLCVGQVEWIACLWGETCLVIHRVDRVLRGSGQSVGCVVSGSCVCEKVMGAASGGWQLQKL